MISLPRLMLRWFLCDVSACGDGACACVVRTSASAYQARNVFSFSCGIFCFASPKDNIYALFFLQKIFFSCAFCALFCGVFFFVPFYIYNKTVLINSGLPPFDLSSFADKRSHRIIKCSWLRCLLNSFNDS